MIGFIYLAHYEYIVQGVWSAYCRVVPHCGTWWHALLIAKGDLECLKYKEKQTTSNMTKAVLSIIF